MSFLAQTGSGHSIMMDGAPNAEQPALSGANLAARPMELLLAGAGGCSAFDVVLMLQRGRHAVHGCSVKITADRADTPPQVFTKIHMHFTVTGKNLPSTAVERAVQMSHEKYCSATIMLGKTAEISTSFEVQEV
jgi:putative redox protein